MNPLCGLGNGLHNLHILSNARSRSISSENPTGAKGKGAMAAPPIDKQTGHPTGPSRDLGRGWKVHASDWITPGQTHLLGDIQGPAVINQVWMTVSAPHYRFLILRLYWDDQEQPSIECPLGDFFAAAYVRPDNFAPLSSMAVCVNPGYGLNCYWPMPFHKRCRITLENIGDEPAKLYYQVNYEETPLPNNITYFHAQFRRTNPLPNKQVHTLIDGIQGAGHYVGTYMAWGLNNNGWWGEGEVKAYIDGDDDDDQPREGSRGGFPTICYTGTEDYFCGAWNFENGKTKQYQEYCTPYAGVAQIVRPDGFFQAQQCFSMYRWHITDPIRFEKDLKLTIQALGWRSGDRYLPLQDDISSVAYWYQMLPTIPFPELPDRDRLEMVFG